MAAVTLAEGDDAALGRALARETELWVAYANRDAAALERLVDPLALDAGPWGVLTRDEAIAAVARMEISSYAIEGLRVRAAGEAEIVSYRATVEGRYAGAPFPARALVATSVWARSGAGWRLVHRHESPLRARPSTE